MRGTIEDGRLITHIVLNNDEFVKISREQVSALRPVSQADLVNPDFGRCAGCAEAAARASTDRKTPNPPRRR